MELETFMVFFGMLTQLLAGREAFEHRYATVIAMVDMLQEYGGKVPPSDQVCFCHFPKFFMITDTRSRADSFEYQ